MRQVAIGRDEAGCSSFAEGEAVAEAVNDLILHLVQAPLPPDLPPQQQVVNAKGKREDDDSRTDLPGAALQLRPAQAPPCLLSIPGCSQQDVCLGISIPVQGNDLQQVASGPAFCSTGKGIADRCTVSLKSSWPDDGGVRYQGTRATSCCVQDQPMQATFSSQDILLHLPYR